MDCDAESVRKEKEFVHDVYEAIASHFSVTRYKVCFGHLFCFNIHTNQPWPQVEKYLGSLSAGSILADVGCGNGKCLVAARQCFSIGLDR